MLVVTEKHKIAEEIAKCLHENKIVKHKTAQYSNAYQFQVKINNELKNLIIVHNSGHNCEYKFINENVKTPIEYLSEDQQIKSIITAGGQEYIKSVKQFINEVEMIVMAQDNDREGEHIAWESVELAANESRRPLDVYPGGLPVARQFDRTRIISSGRSDAIVVRRCKFSSMTKNELLDALSNLVPIDHNVVDAVDVRMQLDLRIGYAISSLQGMNKRKILKILGENDRGQVQNMKLTFGTCQIPTLSLCYNRPPKEQKEQSKICLNTDNSDLKLNTIAVPAAIAIDQSLKCLEYIKNNEEIDITVTDEISYINQPCPLNTIGMQKALSQYNSKAVMEAAEKLYISGKISYPRTETQYFTAQVNVQNILKILSHQNAYQSYIAKLCANQNEFNANLEEIMKENTQNSNLSNDNAHSPIVITGLLDQASNQIERDVYDYVARHFLATVGKKCIVVKRHFKSNIECVDFMQEKQFIKEPGWKEILYGTKAEVAPEIDDQMRCKVKDIMLQQLPANTETPPTTQYELIENMEKYGIGTDATIAEHINTIKDRNYIDNNYNVLENGQIVCKLYQHIDLNVLSCTFRCVMEAGLRDISSGNLDVKQFYFEMIEYARNLHDKVQEYLQQQR